MLQCDYGRVNFATENCVSMCVCRWFSISGLWILVVFVLRVCLGLDPMHGDVLNVAIELRCRLERFHRTVLKFYYGDNLKVYFIK